ncbi:methylenetetrahydrofolate reductase [NAD(P)H] [Phosphitispora sp. TUW77]|uniref:methylenetetrahydrofolate reductase [NAD(P)H] n=1 Tax=Phosphitispora sp. TUW77 TaxID=3152361 RepID=UPI003AB2C2E0
MKVSEILKNKKKPTLSFEYFPGRTEKGIETLNKTIDALDDLKPDFVSVTFGAGGSTREGSYDLVKKIKEEKQSEIIAYLTCYGLSQDDITDILDSYKDLGIENILALRGDAGKNGVDTKMPEDSFTYAYELVNFIRKKYDFCLGVAGYPEGHIEAPDLETDIKYLKNKVDQGADYIIANFSYDNAHFLNFIDLCKKHDINVPILIGIMPVYSIKMLEILTKNCGAEIPEKLSKGISELPNDDKEALVKFGIEYATQQCEELLKEGIDGLHIYTMDNSKSTVGLINNLREKGFLTVK